ncbi:glutamic acid-rich protein-like [Bombus vosnesenskii]|uniref:Glutamic acid-rich protein-like n=1 Tax=Bombus vosnesenskii TaxID=207650 RepID=A0A6J3L2E4_9HYME|nr:glutamic acid-rich protein-like [Bombus vosnesenskii]
MSYTKFNFSFYITCCCLSLGLVNANAQTSSKNFFAEQLTEENWDRMLIGEWMVEFYAPWCPACKTLEPIWEHLAAQKESLNINVGKVDVTDSPGLSGRFMVTALPTIYHVKNGIFRQYKSPRDKDSLIEFVSEKTWEKIEPIPGWKSPTSIQMSVIGQFFQISQVLRGIHNRFMEDFGLPTWGSYLIIAIATIVSGAILGLFIVCLIDFIYPPKPVVLQNKKKQKDGSGGFMQEKSIQDEEIVEHVKDDLVDEESEQEGSETEEKEKDADKDSKTEPSSPNVRKRKPRKADLQARPRFDSKSVFISYRAVMAKANMVKSIKKRSASVSEITEKKTETSGYLNKDFKKKKTENGTVQNGQPNKQITKNSSKKFKNEKKNNDLGIVQNPKKKETNEISLQNSKKKTLSTAELLKLRQEYRKKRKENRLSQTHLLPSNLSVENIKKRIGLIEKREELTRSAKRKLAALKKRLRVEEGVGKVEKGKNEKPEIVKQKQMQNAKSMQEKVDVKSNKEGKKRNAKQSKTLIKQKNEENDDDDEEDEENKDDIEIDDELSEDDGTDVEEGDEDDDDDDDDNDDDEEEEEEEEEEDDDDDDDDDGDEEEKGENKNNEQEKDNEIKKSNVQKGKGKSANVEEDGKKKRYVLFVGNLPYNITNEELKKHFLTKVSEVVDIRIPRKDANTARGFAYVELANNTDYEKALSLNHSFVNGRRINVQYSGPDRKTAVAKNFKLHALQKAGKFAGGRNRYNQKYANNKGKQNMRTVKT